MYKKLADFYIEVLLNQFNLIMNLDKIFYLFNESGIELTHEIKGSKEEFLEFVDLDHTHYAKGFTSAEEVFDFIIGSKYFNRYLFNELELTSLDEDVQNEAEKFYEYMRQTGAQSKYKTTFHNEAYLYAVDYAFPEAGLKKEMYGQYQRRLALLPLNEKISIDKVLLWFSELEGDTVKATQLLSEYGDSVRINETFPDYLSKRTPREVEREFCLFVDNYVDISKL